MRDTLENTSPTFEPVPEAANPWMRVSSPPPHNTRVIVAFLTETGHQGTTEAVYHERSPCHVSSEERAALVAEGPDGIEHLKLLDEDAKAENPNGYFEMSGGDWDAKWYAPGYARRGWDYFPKESAPNIILTHWRHPAEPPALDIPTELANWRAVHSG